MQPICSWCRFRVRYCLSTNHKKYKARSMTITMCNIVCKQIVLPFPRQLMWLTSLICTKDADRLHCIRGRRLDTKAESTFMAADSVCGETRGSISSSSDLEIRTISFYFKTRTFPICWPFTQYLNNYSETSILRSLSFRTQGMRKGCCWFSNKRNKMTRTPDL